MSRLNGHKIPINIVAGPLGVGKTTLINSLLDQREPGERWAVLVNEYGLVGLDAALMASGAKGQKAELDIKEVAGGCICCSAGFIFEVSLVQILQRRPDRLIIEPTGLAALSGILDTLDRPGIRESIDLRSIVCIMDMQTYQAAYQDEIVKDQIEAADILLGGRADLAAEQNKAEFETWANGLFPPKTLVGQVARGQISVEILDLVSSRSTRVARAGHAHGTDHSHHAHTLPGDSDSPSSGHEHAHNHTRHHAHDHNHDHNHDHDHDHDHHGDSSAVVIDESRPIVMKNHTSSVTSTLGWICWDGLVFDAKRVSHWLDDLARLPGSRRTKAVVHTNEGWWTFNIVDGIEELKPSGYRRDSRFEVIVDGENYPDPCDLLTSLRSCLVAAAP